MTILAGNAYADVDVVPVDDPLAELAEGVQISIASDPSYEVGSAGYTTIIIRDNEQPVVMVETIADAPEHGASPGIIRFIRIGDQNPALSVNLDTTGSTADSGADYTPIGTQIPIAAGHWFAELELTAIADGLSDTGEVFVVRVGGGIGYTPGNPIITEIIIAEVAAGVTLTGATNIPVNANDTNNSNWWLDSNGNELVGLPYIRDFDLAPMRDLSGWDGIGDAPAGPAIADPELKQLTATLAGGDGTGVMQVQVIYTDGVEGGRIRLWTDQSKTDEITLDGIGMLGDGAGRFASGTGTPPVYPTTAGFLNFYVEGTRPSKAANDITVRVSFTQGGITVTDEKKLTVTPVVAEFSVTPKQGAQVTVLKNLMGDIVGLNSGQQMVNGGFPDGTDTPGYTSNNAGVVFTANLDPRTGIAGDPQFLHMVTGVTNGNPSGVSLTGLGDLNMQLAAGETFPILDTIPATKPFYPALARAPNTADRVQISSTDTPAMAEKVAFNTSAWAALIERMDVTFDARLLVAWQYPDGTIYTLARADWQVVFRAVTVPFFGLQPTSSSVISASPMVLTNADPARVTGSIYNASFRWVAP